MKYREAKHSKVYILEGGLVNQKYFTLGDLAP